MTPKRQIRFVEVRKVDKIEQLEMDVDQLQARLKQLEIMLSRVRYMELNPQ